MTRNARYLSRFLCSPVSDHSRIALQYALELQGRPETWAIDHATPGKRASTRPSFSDQKKERYLLKISPPIAFILRHPLSFALRVLRHFHANQGILLAGAVAYYALLSMVPLIILLPVALSHLVDQNQLLMLIEHYLHYLISSESDTVMDQITEFMDHRQTLGWLMVGVMLFFSSLAFSVLETTMAIIFTHRRAVHIRHPLMSFLLPYLYMLLLGTGLLIESLLIGAIQTRLVDQMQLFGWVWSASTIQGTLFYSLGLLSQIGLLTLFYVLMPPGYLPLRHALVGGVTASLLWEGVRYMLSWYFANLSMVNVIYGSLTSAVIALLTLEVISIIVLLGAQVIAEYELISDDLTATTAKTLAVSTRA